MPIAAATPTSQTSADSDFAGRLRFMQIDDRTGALLRDAWRIIEPALAGILDDFYRHLLQEPQLAKLIGGDMARLKTAQSTHWARLFGGKFDADYVRGVNAIGHAHNRIGLAPRWYIAGYSFVLARLSDVVVRHHRFSAAHASAAMAAISRAVMLDMEIAISVYQDALLAERQRRQSQLMDAVHRFDEEVGATLAAFAESAGQLEQVAGTLGGNAEQATSRAAAVAAASNEASANVQTVASAAEELSSSVGEINRQVAEASRIVHDAVSRTEQSRAAIGSLAAAAGQIGDIVKLIAGVAGQTNLLALNATIEAARAGDAGRGFAVVAQEVKALAAQTARATDQISQQVVAMQAATAESVAAVREVGATIASVDGITAAVAAAVEQQGAATAEIARNVSEAAHGTEEVTRNIAGVAGVAAETGAAAARLLSAASALTAQSQRLRGQVEAFFVRIRD